MDFPLLQANNRSSTGKTLRLAYLDNAATTQKPAAVLDAVNQYYRHDNANPYRSQYSLSTFSTRLYEAARESIAFQVGADSDEIIFTRNTTESINLVAHSYGLVNLKPGDEVILPISEHHSSLVTWQQICLKTGATLSYLYPDSLGRLTEEEITGKISPQTRIVSLAHISNVLGNINPVETVVKRAHDVGALVLLDCAQSIAHQDLDFHNLEVDFAAFSGHKIYAPMSIGVLYVKKTIMDDLEPFLYGGEMIDVVTLESATFEKGPKRFEAGTPNVAGAVGLATAFHYLETIGRKTLSSIEKALTKQLLEGFSTLDNIKVIANPAYASDRAGVVSFEVEKCDPGDVAVLLDEDNIAIRAGTHCAQPLHRHLGLDASCRVSPCFYNTQDDINRCIEALSHVRTRISKRRMSQFM